MSKQRVAIIGAGPAGLAAADLLNQSGNIDVEVFEAGRRKRARICPVDRGLVCDGCAGTCNVIKGVGGCIQPGDSVKLSAFPSGRRLAEHLGPARAQWAEKAALQFFGMNANRFLQGATQKFGELELRHYPIHEVTPEDVDGLHDKFEKILERVQHFHVRTRVAKIAKGDDGFEIETVEGGRIQRAFDKVIVSTGRSGFTSILRNSHDLNVVSQDPSISVGMRIELPAEMLLPMFSSHKDFKFSKIYNGQKVKSFCFSSAGLNGGRLKYCHYPSQFDYPVIFLDGHADYDNHTFNPKTRTKFGNIGLLVQMPRKLGISWMNEEFVSRYYSMTNGKPLVQTFNSFVRREVDERPIQASVRDITTGRLDDLFSTEIHHALTLAVDDVLRGIVENSSFDLSELRLAANCVGPEVEFFWPTIDASRHFQTTEPGLFFAGDALGIAQGNLQAAVSGVVAAKGILENERKHIPLDRFVAA